MTTEVSVQSEFLLFMVIYVFLVLFLLYFEKRPCFCRYVWPGIHYVVLAGLQVVFYPPASAL